MLTALTVFCVAVVSAVLIFRNTALSVRRRDADRLVQTEAAAVLNYLDRHLSSLLVNDLEGECRMDFVGGPEDIRFIAPYGGEDGGSDLGRFGVRRVGGEIRVCFMRSDRERPDFRFPAGFPGEQMLSARVASAAFRYSDGSAWLDSWDSRPGAPQEGRGPRYVRIEITTAASRSVEGRRTARTFSRTIRMEAR